MKNKLNIVAVKIEDEDYETHEFIYHGESWIKALWCLWQQRGKDSGWVVKLEWRPNHAGDTDSGYV